MKVLKWIYRNKVSLTGIIALIFYILDELFNLQNHMHLTDEAYYGLISLIFILVGYAIKGRGFESKQTFKEAVMKKKLIKEGKTPVEIINILANVLIEDEKFDKKEV